MPWEIKNHLIDSSFFTKKKIKITNIDLPNKVGSINFSVLPMAWKNHRGKKEVVNIGNTINQK